MVTPGFHPNFDLSTFSVDDQRILRGLAAQWFLTNHGASKVAGPSATYRFFLAKPAGELATLLGIDREVVFLIAPYTNLEPRTVRIFDDIFGEFPPFRIENSLRVILSDDHRGAEKVATILKNDPENPTTIVLYRVRQNSQSICANLWSEIVKGFRIRDIFGYQDPVRSEFFFFGRQKLIQELVSRFEEGQPGGLFGVRRSGKTSVVQGIGRALRQRDALFVYVDCQNFAFYGQKWHAAFGYVARRMREAAGRSLKGLDEFFVDPARAPIEFEEEIVKCFEHCGRRKMLIVFDEIERVSPGTADVENWRNGTDFVNFWRTMRTTLHGARKKMFGVLVVGTSPVIFEKNKFGELDNPMCEGGFVKYIDAFDLNLTSEMIATIGRASGLRFDETVVAQIHMASGGIPFFARQICSLIHGTDTRPRPCRINRPDFEAAYRTFEKSSDRIVNLMIGTLRDLYPDEFEMLRALASGDMKTFEYYAGSSPEYTLHLVGYGLVEQSGGNYSLRIEAVRDYLRRVGLARKFQPTLEEKISEINERRDRLERRLRRLIGTSLQIQKGTKARDTLAAAIPQERRSQVPENIIDLMMRGEGPSLFFLDLANFVNKEWELVKNGFKDDKNRVLFRLEDINKLRRDAHAGEVTDVEFAQLRLHFDSLEEQLVSWS